MRAFITSMLLWTSRKGQLSIICLSPVAVVLTVHLLAGITAMILDLFGICLDTSFLPPLPTWPEATMYVGGILGLFAAGNGIEHAATAYRDRSKPTLPEEKAPRLNEEP